MSKAVVVYSGGLDSRTVLQHAINEYDEVCALTVYYGQRHSKEIVSAMEVCKLLGVTHKVVSLDFMQDIVGNNALTGTIDVPEGHYESKSMKRTVVPNRNMIMMSIATAYAIGISAGVVMLGVHSGDHIIYPDCREVFFLGMKDNIELASEGKVTLACPYITYTKADIVKEGLAMGIDYSKSWTCYNGRLKSCGKCGSCIERLEAFELNNVKDPLEYEV